MKVIVSNSTNPEIFWESGQLTPHGEDQLRLGQIRGKNAIVLPLALLNTVRTHSFKTFATDLFLPTLLNHAIKVNNVALKVFASIGAVILDLIFLPLRLIRAPFRIYENLQQPKNPFLTYLIQENVPREIYKNDAVHLRIEREENGTRFTESGYLNFIEVPTYPNCYNWTRSQSSATGVVHQA